MKGLYANILFTADVFHGLARVSFANNANDFLCLMSLLFHVLV
ncbi:hypothetical protein N9107_01505 [bacterium]|nr:hypothetical protein [bacterium]